MKFTLSTKPLSDALNLSVIPGNISKYYKVSCLAQVTATKRELHINLEANNVCTEVILKGVGEGGDGAVGLVDCLVLKQIVNTFDAANTVIEFTDGGLILKSGSSACTLPYLAQAEDGELKKPSLSSDNSPKVKVDPSQWKFIKDYQMYAIALSFAKLVYTRVWVGDKGDVVVGDFDNSIFTFSKDNKFGRTCLLPETIVNMLISLPEGAEMSLASDKSYRIDAKTDGFEYASEFTPIYEEDAGVGSYHAADIMGTVVKDPKYAIKVAVAPLAKFISQSDILSSVGDSPIDFEVSGQEVRIHDDNIDCKVKFEGNSGGEYGLKLRSSLFKSIIGHLDSETVTICPSVSEDGSNVDGLIFWTDKLTVLVGALEE